jgi:hypothetical protein
MTAFLLDTIHWALIYIIMLKGKWLPLFSEYKINFYPEDGSSRFLQNPQPSLTAPHCEIQPPPTYFTTEPF